MRRSLRLTAVGLALTAGVAHAQPVRAPDAKGNRPELEQQFRQRIAKLAQDRIGLTDAQMAQLQQSNARFAPQLNRIAAEERDTRRQLRAEMTVAGQPNQQRVSDLLDNSLQLQKQRIAIIETEQKDLARFMTPVQRARYIALQQQFRRRAQELTRQNEGRESGVGMQRPRQDLKKLR